MRRTAPGPATGTLLGVWAHPDDEAYLSAALMALARQRRDRVVVVTATRGERGTPDPATWPPEVLAPLRERELARSLALLGVHEHHWLGHRDGELADLPEGPQVAALADLMDRVRPDTVVTFGPDGMTGHDDHRTVSRWTTRAWQEAAGPARLWYATLTPQFHRAWGPLNDRVGLWFPGTRPPCTPREQLAGEVVCDATLGELKHAALRAHDSQTRALADLVGADTFRAWWATESFVAASAQPDPATYPPGRPGDEPGKATGRPREEPLPSVFDINHRGRSDRHEPLEER